MLASAQVRAAVATLLEGVALTSGAVHAGRYHPLAESELPAWLIFIEGDDIELQDMHWPPVEQHTLDLAAECKLRSVTDLEGQLDTAELQAMAALFASAPLYDLQVTSITRNPQRDGEAAVATLRLNLQATYFTPQGEPETIL